MIEMEDLPAQRPSRWPWGRRRHAAQSLTAASVRISGPPAPGRGAMPPNIARTLLQTDIETRQLSAWNYYDTVPEAHFFANLIGAGASRCRLVAAKLVGADEPQPILDGRAAELVAMFGGTALGQSELQRRLAIQLSVAGVGYVIAEPTEPQRLIRLSKWMAVSGQELRRGVQRTPDSPGLYLDGPQGTTPRELPLGTTVLRVWRSHPRRWWEADSSMMACLPQLAELELATQHVLASLQSRLYTAGVLFLPKTQGDMVPHPTDPKAPQIDRFLLQLTEAIMTAIRDRSSAAAVVPIIARLPAEVIQYIQRITFGSPIDDHLIELVGLAIDRLAAGLDIPGQMLKGTGDVNHWGQWHMMEQFIQVHVVPVLGLICQAFTQDYLRPAMRDQGVNTQEIAETVMYFDTSPLSASPDQAVPAQQVFDRGGLSYPALRRLSGVSESDAPTPEEQRTALSFVSKAREPLPGDETPGAQGSPDVHTTPTGVTHAPPSPTKAGQVDASPGTHPGANGKPVTPPERFAQPRQAPAAHTRG